MPAPIVRAAPSVWPPLLASLSLGLAPFVPEPHLVGKIRWVMGGANGMAAMDWFDLAFHGAPWVWLGVVLLWNVLVRLRGPVAFEAPRAP